MAGGPILGLLVVALAGRADEAAAVKAIKAVGGKVKVDDKLPGSPVVEVSLFNTLVTDAVLKDLKELKSLQRLVLSHTTVTDTGLKELNDLKSLKTLHLDNTQVKGTQEPADALTSPM